MSRKVYTVQLSKTNCFPYTVPAPLVNITTSPVQSDFYTGLRLNLTCLIQLATPMGYDVDVSADWSKSGSTLTSDSRVSVGEEAVEVEPFLYSTSLVFSSLDQTLGDTGDYTCTVTLTPTGYPFYRPVTVMATRVIQIESKHYLYSPIYLGQLPSPVKEIMMEEMQARIDIDDSFSKLIVMRTVYI